MRINAIAALKSGDSSHSVLDAPRVVIKTTYASANQKFSIEVADNGPGVADSEKVRIFEPYYTTKPSGTGLGLAIVTSVVADHQGEVRIYDNTPHGAKFVIVLPKSPKLGTQRRLAVV